MFGRLHQLIAVTLLFATNGHLFLLARLHGVVRGVPAAPARSIGTLDPDRRRATSGMFFTAALQIAAPVVVVLFLADLGAGPAQPGGPVAERRSR